MEMVAAARLRRAEQRIDALRPYAQAIRKMARQVSEASLGTIPRIPLLEKRDRGNKKNAHPRVEQGSRITFFDLSSVVSRESRGDGNVCRRLVRVGVKFSNQPFGWPKRVHHLAHLLPVIERGQN
jgi:hypothetical protein